MANKESMFFKHDFIRTSLTAFIGSLDNLFAEYAKQHLSNNVFPIFINNSGDEVYLSNMTAIGEKEKEHYNHTPRLSMVISGISAQPDQLTATGITGRIQVANENGYKVNGLTHLRRIPLKVILRGEAVFSKVHELFTFIEYYFSATSHTALGYEYLHAGSVHEGVWQNIWDFDQEINTNLSFDGDKRGIKLPLIFEIECQLPAYNLYRAKGFNYIEEPGIYVNSSGNGSMIPDPNDPVPPCGNCGTCDTCGNPEGNNGMMKIIHHIHMSDPSPAGILSTTIIDKSASNP